MVREAAIVFAGGADSATRLGAEGPAAVSVFAAEDDVENEQLRRARSTQYPRSVIAVVEREYRNHTYVTQ
jgi:hypothetical protein